jgi:hypothetical protein
VFIPPATEEILMVPLPPQVTAAVADAEPVILLTSVDALVLILPEVQPLVAVTLYRYRTVPFEKAEVFTVVFWEVVLAIVELVAPVVPALCTDHA